MILLLWIAFATCTVCAEGTNEYSSPQYTLYTIYVLEEAPQRHYGKEPLISEKEVEECFKEHANVSEKRLALEQKLAKEGRVIKPDANCADISIIRRRRTDPHVHMLESKQLIFGTVTDVLIQKHNLSPKDVYEKLPEQPLKGDYCTHARDECVAPTTVGQCDPNALYRRADGTCNNLQNPDWGSSGVCFRRLLPPSYVGQSGFRQSVLGGPLPQPRDLSVNVHNNLNRPTNYVNHLYMFFGQLLDHDITQAPISTTVDNQAIQCCPPANNTHPQCAPIIIPPNDYFYSQFGTTCMNFVRSAICPTCRLGPRQQINQITAFIDASFVYGNSENETRTLRTLDGTGRLRSERSRYGDLLPSSPDPQNDFCSFPETNDICFQAGDSRANQHPPLTSLHTIFMREHNRLADGLRRMNPSWDDERIFQEARRIVGAEMQVITYKEYLPITLGNERMTFFKLWPSNGGTTRYDSSLDPSLYVEFSAAAFRFGHSLINSLIAYSPLNATNGRRLLRDGFFQPFDLRQGIIGPLMSGISSSPAQWFDRNLVPDVTNYLYRIRGDQTGLDLASINIQRGRDHGLPPYVDMVHFCSDNAFRIQRFDDLVRNKVMTYENMQLLQRNYRDVRDIDLWTGVLSEIYNDGAVVGPTATCVIGLQFNRLKYGDRFYFEHRNQAGSFTYQQMQELRKMTLAKIICLNTEVKTMPLNAMLFNDRNSGKESNWGHFWRNYGKPSFRRKTNPLIYCNYAKGVDLSYWRE
ncbi:chorion peroxidase-like isoform X1 [Argiope bruennichi]|uniref:chorion peroxidase-like isoform X1 n=1 Tax=Argiope bruennichi TaxID=94029 RepID=UPI002493D2F4|nr:chorion peroxidase-like isoform X1 [Argiope bruennichi]